MKLEDVVRWTGASVQGPPCGLCTSVTQDSRTVKPGSLYVALKGARLDGHVFVASALKQGACAALVEAGREIPDVAPDAPLLRVPDTYAALTRLAAGWRSTFHAPETRLVGLTGSSGKTTTRTMTAVLLAATGGKVASTSGNLNNHIGLPLSLLAMEQGTAFGVFETGVNHPGEMDALAATLRPDAVIVTNIGTAHIEFFRTKAGIAEEKGKLLAALPPDGFAVLNTETDCFDSLAGRTVARKVTVSFKRTDADFFGELRDGGRGLVAVRERETGCETLLESGLPGQHNADDLLLAFATARAFGVPPDACVEALRGLSLPGMRWREEMRDGVKIVNDAYNANPDSMAASVRTFLGLPCAGRRILVLGDMYELGGLSESLHRGVGDLVAECRPDGVLFVGDLMAAARDQAIRRGFPEERALWAKTAADAAPKLATLAKSGDSVLLKASRGVALERLLQC